jgi:short subunit dehydrogenase-like uncharacterized protein
MNDDTDAIIIYGSYGYTGKLITSVCKSKQLNIILAGRDGKALEKQSKETGYPFEIVQVDDVETLRRLLRKGSVVIHCAGPFQFTAKAMIEACLETKTHYTDITGEHQVFEMLALYDARGKQAGITIIPGTGFDVVPSDCLALHLKNRLPSATHLQLAFSMSKGGMSRGTSRTMIEGLGEGSMIRRSGKLVRIPLGEKVIEVSFQHYKTKALCIPWGDISTAWRSTGIPNIEVYMGANDKLIGIAGKSTYVNWLLRRRWVKKILKSVVDRKSPGPEQDRRLAGSSSLWGRVWDDSGNEAISTIETISGYDLTAQTSVMIVEKILRGDYKTGFQTPAMAYGPDMILKIEKTVRIDR